MAATTKYPWSTMKVGETIRVCGVSSRATVQVSLARFRDHCRSIGYTDELMPLFSCSYDLGARTVEITRLDDGPMRTAAARMAQGEADERAAQLAHYQDLSDEVDRWIANNNERRAAGLGRLTFPPLRYQELARAAPALAAEVAAIDGQAAVPDSTQHRLRRAEDEVTVLTDKPLPPEHEPKDDAFARRIASACKSKQPGS